MRTIEQQRPSFATKACLAASILFTVHRTTDYIAAPHELIYLGVVVFFVYFRLSGLLLNIHDPFAPIENLFCAIFMWGHLGCGQSCGRRQQGTSCGRRTECRSHNCRRRQERNLSSRSSNLIFKRTACHVGF